MHRSLYTIHLINALTRRDLYYYENAILENYNSVLEIDNTILIFSLLLPISTEHSTN